MKEGKEIIAEAKKNSKQATNGLKYCRTTHRTRHA